MHANFIKCYFPRKFKLQLGFTHFDEVNVFIKSVDSGSTKAHSSRIIQIDARTVFDKGFKCSSNMQFIPLENKQIFTDFCVQISLLAIQCIFGCDFNGELVLAKLGSCVEVNAHLNSHINAYICLECVLV